MASSENQCDICCEDFTKKTRAKVSCPSCDATSCRNCVRTYLMGTNDDPHCMSCKAYWTRETYTKALLPAFTNKEYKNHRKNVMFDSQKSRLQDTMPAVEKHLLVQSYKATNDAILDEIDKRMDDVKKLRYKSAKVCRKMNGIKNGTSTDTKKRVFIRQCSIEDCRGFLSPTWKCGLCNNYTCSKCFMQKGSGENTDDTETKYGEHVCNDNDIKTAELIKQQTKPCPSCAISIEKASGCDQMWCTQCHTAFSWRTGLKINGIIHNPHFYAWQNSGGMPAQINVPGAVMCGGLPSYYNYKRVILRSLGFPPRADWVNKNIKLDEPQNTIGMFL